MQWTDSGFLVAQFGFYGQLTCNCGRQIAGRRPYSSRRNFIYKKKTLSNDDSNMGTAFRCILLWSFERKELKSELTRAMPSAMTNSRLKLAEDG